MKKLLFCLLISCTAFAALAQKDVKYKKIYHKDLTVETKELTFNIVDAVATDAEIKFKLKITNKTNDYIIFKPEESKFIINGKEMKPSEKWLVIAPNETESRVINLKGPGYNTVMNYSFMVEGIYKAVISQSTPAPDFKLPPSQNDFKAGSFSVLLNKYSKETDQTDVKFNCTYNGDQIGFVYPSKVAVRMPDGNDYANAKSKANAIVFLKKGEEDKFTLHWDRMPGGKVTDMQKVEMFIKWNEAFAEAKLEKMKSETLEFLFDELMSNEKGR